MKLLPIITCLLFIVFSNSTFAENEESFDEGVEMDNWKNNKSIVKVRAIYNNIQSEIKKNQFITLNKNYNIKSKLCSTYPIQYKSIATDKSGVVRKLKIIRIVSHRMPMEIERFYDKKGTLRFVFRKSILEELRIYFNSLGEVIWSIEKRGNIHTRGDYENGDWETKPSSSKKAFELYQQTSECPIQEKG